MTVMLARRPPRSPSNRWSSLSASPRSSAATTRPHHLAGHEHPAVVLRDVDGTRHRFPCFHAGARAMVLPAFGSFTGGHTVRPRQDDRLFIVSDAFVHEVRGV